MHNGPKKDTNNLLPKLIDEAIRTNAAFWDEARLLLDLKYEMTALRKENIDRQPGCYVIFERPELGKKLVIIDRKSERAEPTRIDELSIFNAAVTHAKRDYLDLPLRQTTEDDQSGPEAILTVAKPNPRVHWILKLDGTPVKGGPRGKPMQIPRLMDALLHAYEAGALNARIELTTATRKYFKARERRTIWLNEAFQKVNLTLRSWSLDNKHKYQEVQRVVHRGDDIPEIKRQLCEVAEKTEQQMWPVIDWS